MKKIIFLALFVCTFASLSLQAMQSTTLHEAVRAGNLTQTKELIEQGADIHAIEDGHGRTPLHVAALNGFTDIVHYLVEQGATINALDKNGNTPLHLAAQYGLKNMVTILIEKGASLHAKNHVGNTPLHVAVTNGKHNGKHDNVRILVHFGANIVAKNEQKANPLYEALLLRQADIYAYLNNVNKYYSYRNIPTATTMNEKIIPQYLLLAALKNHPYHIIHFIENPQCDYLPHLRYCMRTMQLPEGKDDGGLRELMWRDWEHKKVLNKELLLKDCIVKNIIGFKVLAHYNLYNKTIKPDTHFNWK